MRCSTASSRSTCAAASTRCARRRAGCAQEAASSDHDLHPSLTPAMKRGFTERNFTMNAKIILVTGASSGFGRITTEALARAGHTVYASMRDVAGRNAGNATQMTEQSRREGIDLRPLELDVQSEGSADAAIAAIVAADGRIDVVVHNAGHMMFGPAEAFTAGQFAQQYDVNVLGTQRVNRAVLPHMRAAKQC